MNKEVLIIYCGGTIGGTNDRSLNIILEDVNTKRFEKYITDKCGNEFLNTNIKWEVKSCITKFSELYTPTDWVSIAELIDKIKRDYDNKGYYPGIVIAHGTDTLCYSASALSFMIRNAPFPIIFTASNLPLENPYTDALTNLIDAVWAASDEKLKGKCCIVFSGIPDKESTIHLGNKTRKVRFEGSCFDTVNSKHIGTVKSRFSTYSRCVKIENNISMPKGEYAFKPITITTGIYLFKIFPGFDTNLIKYAIGQSAKGIILELYNSGTGPAEESLGKRYNIITPIEEATERKVPVFVTSQSEGKVEMKTYITSKKLLDAGAIPLYDMITEAAIPKLMWVLSQEDTYDRQIALMLENVAGEITNEAPNEYKSLKLSK